MGISLKQGPPHFPETNGVAEHFTQSFLTKIQCLLAHSNIPITCWDEAAMNASLLLNLLPHQYLQLKSENDVLSKHSETIKPTFKPSQIIPFGIKFVVRDESSGSKVNVTASSMKALTFEPYSDALRVLDSSTGRIRVTHDYAQPKSKTLVIIQKYPSSLPCMATPPQPQVASLPVLKIQSSNMNTSSSCFSQSNEEPT
ncbi:hypothetical protein O181_016723 [Austropuccinia psidii MF-1]|uniref:Integrase catalytic domain-containing protein n=1 Tax=Austropuccinia psidii MF-1 TaxID=1389203 RepID=A0A9Q3GR56_9BASI|nr:hypothetical protein [Austropuccinia psidii MF-1]